MKKIILMFLFTLVFSMSIVSAESFSEGFLDVSEKDVTEEKKIALEKEFILNNLDALKEEYNSQYDDVPQYLKSFLKNEKIIVYFSDDSSVSVTFKKGYISSISKGEMDNPTMKVYVKDQVFKDYNAGSLNLQNSLSSGDLSYKSISLANKFKMSLYRVKTSLQRK